MKNKNEKQKTRQTEAVIDVVFVKLNKKGGE
jgi:hypothetical protein